MAACDCRSCRIPAIRPRARKRKPWSGQQKLRRAYVRGAVRNYSRGVCTARAENARPETCKLRPASRNPPLCKLKGLIPGNRLSNSDFSSANSKRPIARNSYRSAPTASWAVHGTSRGSGTPAGTAGQEDSQAGDATDAAQAASDYLRGPRVAPATAIGAVRGRQPRESLPDPGGLSAGRGIWRAENVARLIEMGYEVYTTPYADWLAPRFKRRAAGRTDWTRVGNNAEMVAWKAEGLSDFPYPLDVALARFWVGEQHK